MEKSVIVAKGADPEPFLGPPPPRGEAQEKPGKRFIEIAHVTQCRASRGHVAML